MKALAMCLKEVMGKLVSKFQMAGVEGRLIQENIFVTNDLLDARLKTRKVIRYKLDFTKAFDCLSWEFLIIIWGYLGLV